MEMLRETIKMPGTDVGTPWSCRAWLVPEDFRERQMSMTEDVGHHQLAAGRGHIRGLERKSCS